MKTLITAIFCLFLGSTNAAAQKGDRPAADPNALTAISATPAAKDPTPAELARLAVAAHGGDKLRGIKTFVVRGTCDVNSFGQAIPATFVLIISGPKYYFEINNPFQPLKQIYNGQETYSSMQAQGFSLPPMTSLGFPLLTHVGDDGYVVSEPAGAKKKPRGFRVTTPEGFYTDFYLDERTNQIKEYESSFMVGDRTITTSVANDEYTLIDGVTAPKRYSQRFDLGSITAYASFKSKEILINSEVKDDVFKFPN